MTVRKSGGMAAGHARSPAAKQLHVCIGMNKALYFLLLLDHTVPALTCRFLG